MTKKEIFESCVAKEDREDLINLCKAFLNNYYKAENYNYSMRIRNLLECAIQQLAWKNGLNVSFNKNYPDKITFFDHDRSAQFRVDAFVGNIIEE